MTENEQDIIAHLLEVEGVAAEMISKAQQEADVRLASVRAKADEDFRSKYQLMISDFESSYKAETEKLDSIHKSEIQSYQDRISGFKKNQTAFDAFLDKILTSAE